MFTSFMRQVYRINLKEYENRGKYQELARELKKKKTMEHEGDNYTNRYWCFWYNPLLIIKGIGGRRGCETSGDYPNYNNIEKRAGEKPLGKTVVLQSWIINCLKMYKISHEVINFIEKTIKTWRVEFTAGGRSFAETKIQIGIFQGGTLSPLLFILDMMPLNHILRKCTAGYKLSRSQEKINHLMYMDGIKQFAKNKKN